MLQLGGGQQSLLVRVIRRLLNRPHQITRWTGTSNSRVRCSLCDMEIKVSVSASCLPPPTTPGCCCRAWFLWRYWWTQWVTHDVVWLTLHNDRTNEVVYSSRCLNTSKTGLLSTDIVGDANLPQRRTLLNLCFWSYMHVTGQETRNSCQSLRTRKGREEGQGSTRILWFLVVWTNHQHRHSL